jgi:hypothetical protein
MGFDVHVLEPEAWEAWLRALPADGAVDRGGGSP